MVINQIPNAFRRRMKILTILEILEVLRQMPKILKGIMKMVMTLGILEVFNQIPRILDKMPSLALEILVHLSPRIPLKRMVVMMILEILVVLRQQKKEFQNKNLKVLKLPVPKAN